MHNSPQPATDDQIWKNFVFNETMMSKVQHSCRLRHRYREDLRTRLSCFACENKNSRTFCRTFYSFHDDLLSKNIARRQLDGQNLLFGVYLQTWTALYLLNSNYRGELDIEEGKHVWACCARRVLARGRNPRRHLNIPRVKKKYRIVVLLVCHFLDLMNLGAHGGPG